MTSPKIESPATRPHLPTTQGFWFESQGVRLYALALGRGRPLVFLHGGLADHRAALVRVGSLADSLQVLAPDLRGSGRSHYAGELSWDLLADDLRALLHSLHIERAVIGGTSMGSAVALRFALRYPRHTAGLVLWAPVCRRQCRSAAERRKLKRLALRVPPEMLEVRKRRQKRAQCA